MRLLRSIAVGATALLAACATAPAPTTVPAEWSEIGFAVKSWGRPMNSWTIRPDGSGIWVETVTEEGASFQEYALAQHPFDAGPEGYRRVAEALAGLAQNAPTADRCRERVTDLPYGTVRFTQGNQTREIAFDNGCRDADYQAFIAKLYQADGLVSGWGAASPVSATITP